MHTVMCYRVTSCVGKGSQYTWKGCQLEARMRQPFIFRALAGLFTLHTISRRSPLPWVSPNASLAFAPAADALSTGHVYLRHPRRLPPTSVAALGLAHGARRR
jgi:hypothetical protein